MREKVKSKKERETKGWGLSERKKNDNKDRDDVREKNKEDGVRVGTETDRKEREGTKYRQTEAARLGGTDSEYRRRS